MRLLALDYGPSRTGVAVSDETGTLARPLTVVGLPVSLDGCEHGQAREVRRFVDRLRRRIEVPVETYDERFTTTIAEQRGGRGALDARAAAALLEDYLTAHGQG